MATTAKAAIHEVYCDHERSVFMPLPFPHSPIQRIAARQGVSRCRPSNNLKLRGDTKSTTPKSLEPIGHPNWVHELRHNGFRGILYVDREQAWLVSRKGKKFRQFDQLLKQVLRSLKGQRAIFDGEIVVLDENAQFWGS